jgi:hypothetical protein
MKAPHDHMLKLSDPASCVKIFEAQLFSLSSPHKPRDLPSMHTSTEYVYLYVEWGLDLCSAPRLS